MSNGLDSVQSQRLWVLVWVQTVCKGYQEVSKITTWRQRVYKIHLEDYLKIVCYAMQKLIVKISSGRGYVHVVNFIAWDYVHVGGLCPYCKIHGGTMST